MADETGKFIEAFSQSLDAETFVKMTLGNYKGSVADLQKILVRPVLTKRGPVVAFQTRYETRETVKNLSSEQAIESVRDHLVSGFRSAHLFTTLGDFQLDIGKRSSRLHAGKAAYVRAPAAIHDRQKSRSIDAGAYYLKALGITTDSGEVRAAQQSKWRQINKFVETLGHLIDDSAIEQGGTVKVVDMGSGKGYLTFAAYDYFTNMRGLNVEMIGVDTKSGTIALCNDIAAASNFDGLKFVNGTI